MKVARGILERIPTDQVFELPGRPQVCFQVGAYASLTPPSRFLHVHRVPCFPLGGCRRAAMRRGCFQLAGFHYADLSVAHGLTATITHCALSTCCLSIDDRRCGPWALIKSLSDMHCFASVIDYVHRHICMFLLSVQDASTSKPHVMNNVDTRMRNYIPTLTLTLTKSLTFNLTLTLTSTLTVTLTLTLISNLP